MNLKDLDLVKLSKLTSEYIDELKCLECCKYFIAPATAACGHTLCHTCWRGRRSCPSCANSLDRKSLKLNIPLQNLTNHVQTLGETFEKLFNIKLEEFNLDTPEELEPDKDPDKNVKDWLTSSQNHFSAPIQISEPFTQESQLPTNPLEISASNVIIHTDTRKTVSPVNVAKVVHVQPPQDDWDKIEPMPEVEDKPKNNENIVGPMDIEPFFVEDSEYTSDHPRRSSRKRDSKYDDSNQKAHELSSHKGNSRDSSCETDKKSQKGKQTWNNVKRMRKEFSKLNKKNRSKLNVSIEMVKKTQNVKPISSTPHIASPQVINIDENTPNDTDKENEMEIIKSNDDPIKKKVDSNSDVNIKGSQDNSGKQQTAKANTRNIPVPSVENKSISKSLTKLSPMAASKEPENNNKSEQSPKEATKMQFVKKGALCPTDIKVSCDKVRTENQMVSGNSDDIEISIKIGNTITNILIKKKNDIQVKINTDREVQTSLGTNNQTQNESAKDKNDHNIDINLENNGNDVHVNTSAKTQVTVLKMNQSVSEKKNTASAETATAQFEITESVEKELSNIMEYETEGQEQAQVNIEKVQNANQVENVEENLDDLNDLDIFNSGSVKEANVQLLKEHAPSEILISTVGSKLKTQRNAEKRNRENTDDEKLPKNKKVKVTSQHKVNNNSTLPDSEPNYDVIMGQVFANIDADIEDIKKSQTTQNAKTTQVDKNKGLQIKNKNLSGLQKTQTIKGTNHNNSQTTTTNLHEYFNEKHSENVFSILEKDDETSDITKIDKMPQQVEDLLTPVLCRNLDSSQGSQDDLPKTNKSNKKSQDYDDSDRSVVEETPQKNISFAKAKRTSTSNISQVTLSETKKIPLRVSAQNTKSIINLTDTDTECNKSSRDVTIVETVGKKKLTLETPLTITKFADHIIHKSTPVARKSLNFENEEDDNDAEQTLCPTSEVVAKTTLEKEFMSKAFENTPMTPAARPLMARNISSKANKKFCLAASCLTTGEIANIKHLCAQWKWTFTEKYTKDITHLVVGVDEERKSQRSVKYMCALAASKWIISFDWIRSCMQTKAIVNEEKFEALDSTGEPGPRRSRIAKHKLFQGIKFYCMPPFSVLDGDTLKSMLVAAGGHVVSEMKEVRVSGDSAGPALLLAEPEHTQEDRFIYLAMEQSIVPVNYEWVLNCLGSYSLGSIQELLLCPSTLLPPATGKWPEVLLAQELD